MSPSAYITKRTLPAGDKRYVVRYRLGGRGFKLNHAGSFKSLKDARARRDFVTAEIAAGRDPRETLRAMALSKPRLSVAQEGERWRKSRVDHSDATKKNVRAHLLRINATFGDRDPTSLTYEDVQAWIGEQTSGEGALKPSSLVSYIATFRQILDFADVHPNPARDDRVRLPAVVREEIRPPSSEHVLAMLWVAPVPTLRPLIAVERTGMRVGELGLTWGDVDVPGSRFRIRSSEAKSRRPRWVPVPAWLMELIEETCPPEDRDETRAVFPGFTEDVARNVMARACRTAKVPHYHPHDLRHRYISLEHMGGTPLRTIADRVGHSRPSVSLEVYSHVMPLEPIAADTFIALVREREGAGRRETMEVEA